MPMLNKNVYEGLQSTAVRNRLTGVFEQVIAPVMEVNDGRLFTLCMGSVARIDPATGNDIWRVGDANQFAQKIMNRMYNLQSGFHQQVVCVGDTLLAVSPQAENPIRSDLTAYNADSGEVKWDWKKNGTGHYVQGRPVVTGDRIYAITNTGNIDINLTVISLDNGKVLSTQKLGTPVNDERMGAPAEMSPRLTLGEQYLFVQTNNGALLALNPKDNSIAWAFTQRIRESQINAMRRLGRRYTNSMSLHNGEVIARNGMVYAKDTRANHIHAFNEQEATLAWQIECEDDATLVHIDDRYLYMLGSELVALDLKTGERVWWTPHPGDESGTPIFTDKTCLIAGNKRLCSVDLSNGKVTEYNEDIAEHATLMRAGNHLIQLTYQVLTSYDLSAKTNP